MKTNRIKPSRYKNPAPGETPQDTLRRAARDRFNGSQDAVALFLTSLHPGLAMRQPLDVAVDPGGLAQCIAVLQPPAPRKAR